MIDWLGRFLVMTMAVFGAKLLFEMVRTATWAKREVIFPLFEWIALLGAAIGVAAALAIWAAFGQELRGVLL